MNTQTESAKAPLDEVMLAMDVVDTLRHRQDLALREIDGVGKEERLIEKLREIYHLQGIEVPDHILKEGVSALAQNRFVYEPVGPSFGRSLAQLYVSRGKWGRPLLVGAFALALGLGAYFFAYLPYQSAQKAQAEIHLREELPQQMQALYDTIFEETKVQTAANQGETLLARGQVAAAEGNREVAEDVVTKLTDLRDVLRQEYTLRVVNREGVRSGFWTFPEINQDATNYYIVVEAVEDDGDILTLPILNEETDAIEQVAIWGVRVPEAVYDAVAADKQNDGIIQGNVVGQKAAGYVDVKYAVPVLGGTLTRW